MQELKRAEKKEINGKIIVTPSHDCMVIDDYWAILQRGKEEKKKEIR